LADLDSVPPRQHYVQKDEIVIVDAGLVERGLPVERNVDGVGLFAKTFRKNLGRIGLVFHQQYPQESLPSRAVCADKPLMMLAGDT
jgi:hypothetical protein